MRRKGLFATTLLVLAALTACAPSPQTPAANLARAGLRHEASGFGSFDEYPIPGCGSSGCQPVGIALGPDAEMWFTNASNYNIGEIDTLGNFKEHNVGYSIGEITQGPDHAMWFAGGPGVGRLTLQGKLTFWPAGAGAFFIAAGPPSVATAGGIWFSDGSTHSIDKMSLTGNVTPYKISSNHLPIDLVATPDGTIWFTAESENVSTPDEIGKVTPSGSVTEFPVPNLDHNSIGITVGPDGQIWFTTATADVSQSLVGRSTLDGKIMTYPVPTANALLWGIARGPSNDLYFTETSGAIGRITLTSGVKITEYKTPTSGSNPLGIALGADKNMWFAVPGYDFIGRFHTH